MNTAMDRSPICRVLLAALVGLLQVCGADASEVTPVPQPIDPQKYIECVDLGHAWYEKTRQLEQERAACDRRDGGTIKADGIWMPNCGYRQQAYITCAGVQDQVCQVRNVMNEAVKTCNRQVAENLSRARQKQATLDRIERDVQAVQQANEAIRGVAEQGVAGYVIDRYTATPQSATSTLHDAVKEAARTTGTTAPDSQPALNRVGRVTDRLWQQTPYAPVVKEIGQQSGAAARARMGDALNEMDGSLGGAEGDIEVDTAARNLMLQRALAPDLLPPCRPSNNRDPRLTNLPPCRPNR